MNMKDESHTSDNGPAPQPVPSGWQTTTLGAICLPVQKVQPQDEPDHSFTYLDIASIDNTKYRIVSPKTYSGANAPSRARQRVRGGNTLFSTVRTYLKNIAMVPPEFDGQVASTGFCVLNPSDAIDPRYVFYHTVSDDFVSNLNPLQRGTSYPAVRNDDVLAQRIDLPPLPEQRRIVAEIEKQFTRLDASVAALQRTQANLKRYRASVLRAACSGELVATEAELARAEGREYEPADVLLERILAERRARWEAQEKRRGKYKEPAAPDTSDLPPLPEGWAWATVEQLASMQPNSLTYGPFGSNLKTSHYTANGPRVIRLQNIGDGQFVDAYAHISEDHFESLAKHQVFAGNLVIASLGEVLPRSCVIPPSVGPAIVKADCIKFEPSKNAAVAEYLNIALNARQTRRQVADIIHGIGRPRLNLREIKGLRLPLPPLKEQRRIVAEVERRLSLIQQAEAAVEASLQRTERLRQSILKRAFSGQLVPQDPDDEPASALLERIRAQREAERAAAAATKKRPAQRRRSKPKGQQLTLEEASA